MQWGIDDCLTDLFGPDAHKKFNWVRETHNETFAWVNSLSERDRLHLFRSIGEGQGFIRVDTAQPDDVAIGHFIPVFAQVFELPVPWFAKLGRDHHWYVRLPTGFKVVDYINDIEVYRCRALLSGQ